MITLKASYLRLARKGEQFLYDIRRRLGLFKKTKGNPHARIGVYVAYWDASWIFEDHLRCVRDLSAGPINYYVMANCRSSSERAWFDAALSRFSFPIPFHPWSQSPILTHGESLQRMIEATSDEIIVLCDVDAFPIKYGWDDWIVEELAHKDAVAVVVDMPGRDMPVFLHPSFIAFKRRLLVDNDLDVLTGEGNDPAYKISRYLMSRGRMTQEHVTPLFPVRHAIPLFPQGTGKLFGRGDLRHGFGTTYSDWVFHFWFGMFVARREAPKDQYGNELLSLGDMDRVLGETQAWIRGRCSSASPDLSRGG